MKRIKGEEWTSILNLVREITQRIRSNKFGFNRELCVSSWHSWHFLGNKLKLSFCCFWQCSTLFFHLLQKNSMTWVYQISMETSRPHWGMYSMISPSKSISLFLWMEKTEEKRTDMILFEKLHECILWKTLHLSSVPLKKWNALRTHLEKALGFTSKT